MSLESVRVALGYYGRAAVLHQQHPTQTRSTRSEPNAATQHYHCGRTPPASSLPAFGIQMCVQTEPASCCTASTCLTYKDNKNSMPTQLTSRSNIQEQHPAPTQPARDKNMTRAQAALSLHRQLCTSLSPLHYRQ